MENRNFLDFIIFKAVENWARDNGVEDYEIVEDGDTRQVVGEDRDGNRIELDITKPKAETRAARSASKAVSLGLLPPQCAPYVRLSPPQSDLAS